MEPVNPFQVTKAVDFTDSQIEATWVDLPAEGGFRKLVDPRAPMPRVILGGKGAGRTHLMRYFSFPLQILRHDGNAFSALGDGYLGIYFRCSGLNAQRFRGKDQDEERWISVFSYYMDLWLSQFCISTLLQLIQGRPDSEEISSAIANEFLDLFDESPHIDSSGLAGILIGLRKLQSEIDLSVNNAALTRKLSVRILTNPGSLVFGLPRVAAQVWRELENVQFLYLLDEVENLLTYQQRYINTLVRDRKSPCSLILGARTLGIRTWETLVEHEENKDGSEFDSIKLDSNYLDVPDQYEELCQKIVAQRLIAAQKFYEPRDLLTKRLDSMFETQETIEVDSLPTWIRDTGSEERPYFRRLRKQLLEPGYARLAPGVRTTRHVDSIMSLLEFGESPLLEKANCFLLYRAWSRGIDLNDAATMIARGALLASTTSDSDAEQSKVLRHFKADLVAQLYKDFDQRQQYMGLSTFIDMSGGIIRNLLVALKYVYQFASFAGEDPLTERPISANSQTLGVLKASDWYFNDASLLGPLGDHVRSAMVRLGNLFRRLRFSDKPSESSLIAFSADMSLCSDLARETVRLAEGHSLLIKGKRGQRDRNTSQVNEKFQLNPMLCPRWDLPVNLRGAIALSPSEMEAIFGNESDSNYQRVVSRRLLRTTAPFAWVSASQAVLPGMSDD